MIIGCYVVHAVTTMDLVVLPIIGQIHAWQMAFLNIGPPGIIVAFFVARLREPVRQGGVHGIVGGGWLGDQLSRRSSFKRRLRVGVLVALLGLPAILSELAPNQMRGQLAALSTFSVNIVGLGFGATLVALASDYIFTAMKFCAMRWR